MNYALELCLIAREPEIKRWRYVLEGASINLEALRKQLKKCWKERDSLRKQIKALEAKLADARKCPDCQAVTGGLCSDCRRRWES